MHQSHYQSNNQFLLMGVTIFASITAAVIISTLIIMTLMKGEIAGALSSQVQTTPATVQTTGTCAVPANEVQANTAQSVSAETTLPTAVSFVSGVHHMLPAVQNSFNNTSTTTTTNNVTNAEIHKKTIINDSYNTDNYTITVVKDNTVNVNSNNKTIDSNNTVKTNVIGNTVNSNSNNTSNTTTNTTTNNVIGNTTNVASNNTVNSNSNNTMTKTTNVVENHLLSDNVTVVAPSV